MSLSARQRAIAAVGTTFSLMLTVVGLVECVLSATMVGLVMLVLGAPLVALGFTVIARDDRVRRSLKARSIAHPN